MNPVPSTTAAILATYNERENILPLVDCLLALPENLSVVIVDDHSPDGTAQAIRERYFASERVVLIEREGKLGYGTAMVAGFQAALEKGFQKLVTLDADFSHDPAAVPELLDALSKSDLVVGSRYKDGVRVLNWPPRRLLLSLFANRYVRTLLSLPTRDSTSGFRAYHRRVLESIHLSSLKSQGYAFLVEVLYRAHLCGFSVEEVPVIFTERREGQSKMSHRVILESVGAPWRMRLAKSRMMKSLTRRSATAEKVNLS